MSKYIEYVTAILPSIDSDPSLVTALLKQDEIAFTTTGFYTDGNVDRTLFIFKDVENFRQARSILAYADITCNYIPIADSVYPAMMEAKETIQAKVVEHSPYITTT